MEKLIEEKIQQVAGMIKDDSKGDEVLKYTQAMLNLAHTLNNVNKDK